MNLSVPQVLSLAGNQLSTLPASLSDLSRLRKLNLSHNLVAHVPACVYHMRSLVGAPGGQVCQPGAAATSPLPQVFLHLASNRLESLAENIQALVELKILIVEGNRLHSLPKAVCCLTR